MLERMLRLAPAHYFPNHLAREPWAADPRFFSQNALQRAVHGIARITLQNRTWPEVRVESAFGRRAEVEFRGRQVR